MISLNSLGKLRYSLDLKASRASCMMSEKLYSFIARVMVRIRRADAGIKCTLKYHIEIIGVVSTYICINNWHHLGNEELRSLVTLVSAR